MTTESIADILAEIKAVRTELRRIQLNAAVAEEIRALGHRVLYNPETGVSSNICGCFVDVAKLRAGGMDIDPNGNIVVCDE